MKGESFSIDYLVLSVGQACNLRCVNCGNFAPILPKITKRYDLDSIVRDLGIVEKNCEIIKKIQIQGGEPFLYSQLDELLEYIWEQKDKYGWVQIATNGCIHPGEKILEAIRKYGFEIRISSYDVNGSYSTELADVCKTNGIRYRFYDFADASGEWCDLGALMLK